jgi:hypothetical protein
MNQKAVNEHHEFNAAMRFLEVCRLVWHACARLAEAEPGQRTALGEFEIIVNALDALRQAMTICISDDNKAAKGMLHTSRVAIDKARAHVWEWKNRERS